MSTTLYLGDILKSQADVIVNPANAGLMHGGGLAYRIAQEASRKRWFRKNTFQKECDEAPPIPTGSAYMTSAGALHFKRVVHAVGPVWSPATAESAPRLLAEAYLSAIDMAMRNSFHSIAFPAISAGIFGVPMEMSAEAALLALRRRYYSRTDSRMALDVEFWLWRPRDAMTWAEIFDTEIQVKI